MNIDVITKLINATGTTGICAILAWFLLAQVPELREDMQRNHATMVGAMRDQTLQVMYLNNLHEQDDSKFSTVRTNAILESHVFEQNYLGREVADAVKRVAVSIEKLEDKL